MTSAAARRQASWAVLGGPAETLFRRQLGVHSPRAPGPGARVITKCWVLGADLCPAGSRRCRVSLSAPSPVQRPGAAADRGQGLRKQQAHLAEEPGRHPSHDGHPAAALTLSGSTAHARRRCWEPLDWRCVLWSAGRGTGPRLLDQFSVRTCAFSARITPHFGPAPSHGGSRFSGGP